MEKTFANATLLSATVLAAFMIMIPINHLSAQNEVKIDEKVKVRKGTIEDIAKDMSSFTVNVDGASISVRTNASTTISLGNGDETDLSSLKDGANIYVFGDYDSQTKDITATKIVIRNKRITERTSLSRAEMKANQSLKLTSPLEVFGLTAR